MEREGDDTCRKAFVNNRGFRVPSSVVHPLRDNGCAQQPAIKITHGLSAAAASPGQIMSTAQEIKPTYANDDPSSLALPLLIFARRKCSNDVP